MGKSFLDLINDATKGGSATPVLFTEAQTSALGRGVWPKDGAFNASSSTQTVPATTRTYLNGTALIVPPSGLVVGTILKWVLNITKDANGTAASTFDIAFGSTGTVSDTARVSFTKPAGTAVADAGQVTITAVVRSVGAAGVMVGNFQLTHNLSATGHAQIPCVVVNTISSGFNVSAANMVVGLCLTSGAADNITVELAMAEAIAF
jgi:hypothetical protein